MTNWQRMDALLAHLREHPEEHDQSLYGHKTECGTTACAAGTAGLLFAPERVTWAQLKIDPPGSLTLVTTERLSYGAYFGVGELARELLDLTPDDSDAIFHDCANLGEIEVYVKGMREREEAQASA